MTTPVTHSSYLDDLHNVTISYDFGWCQSCIAAHSNTKSYPDFREHKRVIIHVPVVTRTVYKIIDKGQHKHGGEVMHHHHHGGHVAHIHKHEGGAAHKHHHVGTAGHSHKHLGAAVHKHLHSGKGEHGHVHHGHAAHEHMHKGIYGHDHKHIGAFTGSHAHAGSGLHTHGHDPGHYPTAQEAFAAYGINPVGYLGLSFSSPQQQPHQTDWMAFQPPTSIHPNYSPYSPSWSTQYAPFSTYHQDNVNTKTPPTFPGYEPVVKYSPEPANVYSNVKSQGGVTTYSLPNSKQVVKSEYEENPREVKKHKKITRGNFNTNLFSPALTNELEDTVSAFHDFDDFTENLEDDTMSTITPEYDSQELVGFEEAMNSESEEGGQGAFQSPVKTRVPFAKRRVKSSYMMPVVLPYEVTEVTPYF